METYAYQNKTFPQRFFGHLGTVLTHKRYVAEGCFKLGLYRQGILHDLSKFSPTEFITSVRYYEGFRSPNAVERELYGCSRAWLHHKGRNRHHFEYWVDFSIHEPLIAYGCKMPLRYVAEMVCDRRAACKAYHRENYRQGDAWEYYERTRRYVIMHADTRAVLEKCLVIMRDEGEDAAFAYLRKLLSVTMDVDYTAESLGLSYEPLH
ncbi:MAG: DUF5662 family protein [Eubacteriales bacterium]|nr:DUF5662 family protein [Eubacteriales bacterium]